MLDNPKKLAIIIPAYKDTFLQAALESIAAQTCQEFTLYIGDDCSPYSIKEIVDKYRDQMDIVYKRFEENLGGRDLVAQWERCIAMSIKEPYMWLFSDDDIMEPTCVELFYKELEKTNRYYDLYHFDVKIINNQGEITKNSKPYPQDLDCLSFYKGKLKGVFHSLVVENIFTRDVYNKNHGFKNFDLAWGSDTATWTIFSADKGFHSIHGAYVLWRSSDQNITPDLSSHIVSRKVKSLLAFFEWGISFFKQRRQNVLYTNIRAYINRLGRFQHYILDKEFQDATHQFCKTHNIPWLYWPIYYVIKYKKQ